MTTQKSWRSEGLHYVSQKRDTLWRLRSGEGTKLKRKSPGRP
jgi:hypothetical protein